MKSGECKIAERFSVENGLGRAQNVVRHEAKESVSRHRHYIDQPRQAKLRRRRMSEWRALQKLRPEGFCIMHFALCI
jgi:hypothetical protein